MCVLVCAYVCVCACVCVCECVRERTHATMSVGMGKNGKNKKLNNKF
jgi:hypothetical protein